MLTYGSELLKKTATQSFWSNYYGIPDPFEGLVWQHPSTQITDTFVRLGAAPMPEEWGASKNIKAANEYTYSITNKAFASGVRIDKKLIKFQQWDEIGKLVGNLGSKARAHRIKNLSTIMAAGTGAVCEDGQYFFDDDHANAGAEYTTNQDNNLTGAAATGTQPTDLEAAAAINSCFAAMMSFKDDRGDPAVPDMADSANFICMVPAVYWPVFNQVETADLLSGPIGNYMQGKFRTRLNPFISTTDRFYFFYAGNDHKPFIENTVSGVNLDDSASGDEYFHTGNICYSADYWGNHTYGEWRSAVIYIFT